MAGCRSAKGVVRLGKRQLGLLTQNVVLRMNLKVQYRVQKGMEMIDRGDIQDKRGVRPGERKILLLS